VIKPFS